MGASTTRVGIGTASGSRSVSPAPPEAGIYTLNLDNLGFTRLTFVPAQGDDFPSWSADGLQLAFTSFRDRDSEIYVMNADGTEQTRLTVTPGEDAFPRWSR